MATRSTKAKKAPSYRRIVVGTLLTIMIAAIVAKNAAATHVDLLFIEGDVSVFELILLAFAAGFLSCLSFMGLRSRRVKRNRRSRERADALDDDFSADEGWGVP